VQKMISKTIAKTLSWLDRLQAKHFVFVMLFGVLLFTSNLNLPPNNPEVNQVLNNVLHQDNEQRPKTTEEWNEQARETKGKPGERLKRIEKQSAEAVKDFGALYPDTAKRSAAALIYARIL